MAPDNDELYSNDEDDEELEREEEKELEEFLYRQIHYASELETEIQILENSKNKEANFPEVTPLQTVLGIQSPEERKRKKYQIAVVSEDTDQWDVDQTDLGKTKQFSAKNRYYIPLGEKGPACYLCGTEGHTRQQCPNELCYNCLMPGHIARNCEERKKKPPWHLWCKRCRYQGHQQDECTEIWRQYHFTVEPGKIVKPKHSKETNKHRCCYNCASKKHFGEDCPERRYSNRCIYSQFVVSYDKCPAAENARQEKLPEKSKNKKLKNKKLKEAESTESYDDNRKEKKKKKLVDELKTLVKGKDSGKEKTKDGKDSKSVEIDKAKNTKEKTRTTTKKQPKKPESLKTRPKKRDSNKVEGENSNEIITKNEPTEKSKSKKDKNDKPNKSNTETIKDDGEKTKKDGIKEGRKGMCERAKAILKNMWVSEEDLHVDKDSENKKVKNKFSVTSDLKISPKKDQFDSHEVTKDNSSKAKSLKRKLENIVPKNSSKKNTDAEKSKAKKAKLSEPGDSGKEERTTRNKSGSKEKRPENSINKETREIKEDTKKSKKQTRSGSASLTVNKEERNKIGKNKKSKEIRQEKKASSSAALDLDHETLKNLQQIFVDTDDEDDDNVTFETPCPVPNVNVVYLSSDDDDDDDDDDDYVVENDFTQQDGSSNQQENHQDCFVGDIQRDETHYDPCKVYEDDLSVYKIAPPKYKTTQSSNKFAVAASSPAQVIGRLSERTLKAKNYSPKELKELLTKGQRQKIRRAVSREQVRLGIDKSLPFYQQKEKRKMLKQEIQEFRRAETERMLEKASRLKKVILQKSASKKRMQEKRKAKQLKKQNIRERFAWNGTNDSSNTQSRYWTRSCK